jgi:hypothetical protein
MAVVELAPDELEAPETDQPEGGEPEAKPEAGVAVEAEPEAKETPETRTFSQDEWSRREATLQRERTATLKAADEATEQANQAAALFNEQATLREIVGYRDAALKRFDDMGVEKPEDLANELTQATAGWFQATEQVKALTRQLAQAQAEGSNVATQAVVLKIATDLGITDPAERAEMMSARDEDGARAIGQRIVDSNAHRKAQTEARLAEVPTATTETAMDAGGGDATESDAAFERRVSEMADWSSMKTDDRARLTAIQAARG